MTFIINIRNNKISKVKIHEEQKQTKVTEKINKDIEIDNQNKKQINKEVNNQNIETQKQSEEIQKIKSILTAEILQNFSEVKEALESNNTDEIINSLQNNLPKLVKALGWIGSENYEIFKATLINVDSSFETYFQDLENINTWKSISTNEIINSLEKDSWWVIDFDLKANPAVNKMSLIGSEYSFSKDIDLQALTELRADIKVELADIQNGSSILNDFDKSFNSLLWNIWKVWNSENFNDNLHEIIANFSKDIFNELDDVYKNIDIPSDMQIKESDISNLSNINSQSDLKSRIDMIKDKFTAINSTLGEAQEEVLVNYEDDIKELLQRESAEKERQLEVLEFMNKSWFDLIPQELSNKFIKSIWNNTLVIPWLNLIPQNIDLKNWHFGESEVLSSEEWFSMNAKRNLLMFMNKMISWDINEPLSVESIANWTMVADRWYLKNKFVEAGLVDNLWWKYYKITDNLKHEKEES